ncbi:MAG: acyl-CoA dehydrogenase family protein [Alphaproteobacteria bacterium]|nr:acyl-CoA dehydrogenase family protein [Alphaproteobacteria bacterium]MCB9928123.1 acyl-CoA dehydrogenase family protein [Alphaproteobacteria bacterium]
MDLSLDQRYVDFRTEVRGFIAEHRRHAPPAVTVRDRVAPTPQQFDWQKRLIAAGYAARTVPADYGGFGAPDDILETMIINEEFSAAGVQAGLQGIGIMMLVPTLLEVGTAEQKARYVPKAITGEEWWCQGYSEPGSGSDLASLRTSARLEGEEWVINGQKIWTSGAHYAQMMFCLVRTEPDAPKHRGISYLLIPMETPGVTVSPLKTMTGRSEFNQVFFDEVRIPATNIVAGRGEGWKVANVTLKHERGGLGDPAKSISRFDGLVKLMRRESVDGRRAIDDPLLADRLMQLEAKVLALKFNNMRVLTADLDGADPGLARLVTKYYGTVLNHELDALAIDAMGELGVLYEDGDYLRDEGAWQAWYMHDLGLIIGGGSTNIQRNIIAERGLDLPREPKAVIPPQGMGGRH